MKPNLQIPLFEKEVALDRLGGDKELLSEIITVFCQHLPSEFSKLEALLDRSVENPLNQKELEQRTRAFHSIRGAAANIGASRLSNFSMILEEKSSNGEVNSKEEIQNLSDLLSETILIVKEWSSD